MVVKITLVCFNCTCKHEVFVTHAPSFAFELADIANKVGMLGVLDTEHNRALVFCNKDCASMQITKRGSYRVRPKRNS